MGQVLRSAAQAQLQNPNSRSMRRGSAFFGTRLSLRLVLARAGARRAGLGAAGRAALRLTVALVSAAAVDARVSAGGLLRVGAALAAFVSAGGASGASASTGGLLGAGAGVGAGAAAAGVGVGGLTAGVSLAGSITAIGSRALAASIDDAGARALSAHSPAQVPISSKPKLARRCRTSERGVRLGAASPATVTAVV